MPDSITANCELPLLMPAQAQKHVTVNEALLRLDGQVDLVLQGLGQNAPPATAVDGQCWAVGANPVNAWQGQQGRVAIAANGGWIFVQPRRGRRAFVIDQGAVAVHDGNGWVAGAVTLGAHGSGMIARQAVEDVTLTAAGQAETEMVIPSGALVIGATARVVQAITGSATSWSLGTPGDSASLTRFGQGLGKAQGSWARGLLSPPMVFWTPTPLRLTATGGQFQAGRVRVVLHWWELRLPD
ncbi:MULTISPECIES: DUF2793 domain-containing protein [unclassified Paracoccus (in: a-proteobacteria)]|uniref:DUF2793 domain-containing protein n=1 Tax=unclassified Paracoccus (in: a-proteobacteria) TaxID=2688777 RepID=UPI0012B33157|nr:MULTISPECIES: DUF2793 domain-containing protein [unclassified Paracoccus (in: a-proteobacteria)]UXU74967.1 DUF2793 domain-containing protein [Paracoccus sp. SMMA_5]UXU80870.1 DUF2793 domain-containing protein [Paracoccus sp. SMMA_5_TC]